MRRIALLGDSHLANWKGGWDRIKEDFPDVDLTFFASAGGKGLMSCRATTDRLVIEDEEEAELIQARFGGKRDIIAADYDAFCVVGLRFGVRIATELYARHRADAHRLQEGRFRLISDACFLDIVCDRLACSPAMVLAHKLRSITEAPIFVGVQPAPSEAILKSESQEAFPVVQFASRSVDAETLRATYEEACRGLAGDGIVIVDQPTITLASPLLSKEVYQRESSTVPDWTHMNAAFGEITIRDLLSSPLLGHQSRIPEARTEGEELIASGEGLAGNQRNAILGLMARTLRSRLQLLSRRGRRGGDTG